MEESKYLKKTRLQYEIEYSNNFSLIANQFIEWKKSRPDNVELRACADALARIGIYVSSMQMEQQAFEQIVSQYRMDKLKYQQEALEAVKELRQYEDKYFKDE